MKYLSHFIIRAFVVIGLSLGCVKAQLTKAEVQLYFSKAGTAELGGCYDFAECLEIADRFGNKEHKEEWVKWHDLDTHGPIKVTFHENSLIFQFGNRVRLYAYQHIKRLRFNIIAGKAYLFIKQ